MPNVAAPQAHEIARVRPLSAHDLSLTTMSPHPETWQDRCKTRKRLQIASIPKDWLIELPTDDQRDVRDVPRTCGLLTPRELEITDTLDVDILLLNLRTGVWSAVEVTTAFYKRAVAAHQLVLVPFLRFDGAAHTDGFPTD